MGVFQNALKARHYNESLSQKPTFLLAEVVTREEYYVKVEESNTEKNVWEVKERVLNTKGSHH